MISIVAIDAEPLSIPLREPFVIATGRIDTTRAALPKDPRVETLAMFGGVAAKVNGNIFAGLFGRSTMLALPEPDRTKALALDGAGPFDPMGDGRARSQKVMLPERMMHEPKALRAWIARAFTSAAKLPAKKSAKKPASAAMRAQKKR